jgi:hypothetical protein
VTFAKFEEVAVFDDDGHVTGLQFDSRARRLQQWREKKEEEQYEKLFNKLRAQRSISRYSEETIAKIKASRRRWQLANREHVYRRLSQRRREAYYADPAIRTCEQCGASWCYLFGNTAGRLRRFCDQRCRIANRKAATAARGLRTMDIKDRVRLFLQQHGPSTLRQISDGTTGNQKSLSALLCNWAKVGILVQEGKWRATYSLPPGTVISDAQIQHPAKPGQ